MAVSRQVLNSHHHQGFALQIKGSGNLIIRPVVSGIKEILA